MSTQLNRVIYPPEIYSVVHSATSYYIKHYTLSFLYIIKVFLLYHDFYIGCRKDSVCYNFGDIWTTLAEDGKIKFSQECVAKQSRRGKRGSWSDIKAGTRISKKMPQYDIIIYMFDISACLF